MALGKYALEDGSLDHEGINKLRRGFSGGFGFLVPAALPDALAASPKPEGQLVVSGETQEADEGDNKDGADDGTAPAPAPAAVASSRADLVDPSSTSVTAASEAAPASSSSVVVVNGLKVDEALVGVVAARCAAAMKKANVESASGQVTAKAIADKLATQASDGAGAAGGTAGAETKSNGDANDKNDGDDAEEEEDTAIGGIEGLDVDTTTVASRAANASARVALKRQALEAAAPFEPAPQGTWNGPRPGRYFGTGELGVGYYRDYYPVSFNALCTVLSRSLSLFNVENWCFNRSDFLFPKLHLNFCTSHLLTLSICILGLLGSYARSGARSLGCCGHCR